MTLATTWKQRRVDWVLYVLLLIAVWCLPAVIRVNQWVPEANRLLYVAFWGSLVGVLLARTPFPDWLSWLIGVILGTEYSVQYAGRLLPRAGLLLSDLSGAFRWLWQLVVDRTISPEVPFAATAQYVRTQVELVITNLTQWYQTIQTGGASKDNTALLFGVALVIWLLTWNAGYQLFRRRNTFAALLPLGVAVVANVSVTYVGMEYVRVYLGVILVTLVWANIGRMERLWARLGLDFSNELKRDTVIAGSIIATLIFVVALLLPYMTYSNAVFFFWDLIKGTVQPFYKDLDRAFAGRNPVPELKEALKGLPSHAISEGSLSDETVLLVQTSDPPPLPPEQIELIGDVGMLTPKHYWRERTYDVYTGNGWESSQDKPTELQSNQPWAQLDFPHTVLTQTYTLRDRRQRLAFAVNEPVAVVDKGYRTLTRGDGDLAGLTVNAEEYTVVSWIPEATLEQLLAAEGPYPDWVASRYLVLPNIPDRITELAQQIVSEARATTRYDKARAIETYIRQFEYDLDLEPPSLDTDFVDYFLFTAQRGYCDYSASAMVVMLRSVGVAARYASGYGQGTYNSDLSAWIVNAQNAHAWVEVYFPGYGWIEFEPTPIQTIFTYVSTSTGAFLPGDATTAQPEAQPIPLWVWGGGLALVLLFVIIWPPRWFQRGHQDPRKRAWQVYSRLTSKARWLGLAPAGGQTPQEYLGYLSQELARRAGSMDHLAHDIDIIGRVYQVARYSNQPITDEDGYRAEGAWRRLSPRMTRLLFARNPSSRN